MDTSASTPPTDTCTPPVAPAGTLRSTPSTTKVVTAPTVETLATDSTCGVRLLRYVSALPFTRRMPAVTISTSTERCHWKRRACGATTWMCVALYDFMTQLAPSTYTVGLMWVASPGAPALKP